MVLQEESNELVQLHLSCQVLIHNRPHLTFPVKYFLYFVTMCIIFLSFIYILQRYSIIDVVTWIHKKLLLLNKYANDEGIERVAHTPVK